jgi:surface polysaccharide O-acyltransferase-like enzyme
VEGVKKRRTIFPFWIILLLFFQVVIYVLLHNTNYYIYAPLAVTAALIMATLFHFAKAAWLRRMCVRLGRISLESYLCNVVLIDVISLIPLFLSTDSINRGNYLYYGVVIILTVAGAHLVSWVSKHVIIFFVRPQKDK